MPQQIETVRGPVAVEALGETLMHEHVFVLSEEIRENYPAYWNEAERVEDAVRKLNDLAARGVRTIVDPTVIGLGRSIPRVAQIAARVDLNIVVATGLYTYDAVPLYFSLRGPGTMLGGADPMIEMFVRDICEGIAETGVKAAFLKCAIEHQGMTPGVERVMRAVAAAHRETGAPITVHTHPASRSGTLALELFRAEGVDLSKVVLGHSGDSADAGYLAMLADAGAYLGMDRFGIDSLAPFEQRVATVAELCRRGYAERMVLSQDASCFIDWLPQAVVERGMPNWRYTHIHDDVLPALRERGVTDAQIRTMLVENPRRYFS